MKLLKPFFKLGIYIGIFLTITSGSLLILNSMTTKATPVLYENNGLVKTNERNIQQEIEQEQDILPYELKESGWIPNWGFDIGMESLEFNKGIIDTVNPVLYTVDTNGNIIGRGVSETNIQKLLTYTRANNVRVIPTIGSYDYNAMASALSSKEKYTENIYTILSEIGKYDFDGIDIDYELIGLDQKDNYILFLNDLAKELKTRNKVLSVTVFPQWDSAKYVDHIETRTVQDYKEIGGVADEVRIMTYDYTLQASTIPGPIAPVNWIRQVLDYATKHIEKEKIWLGVHLYGYEWISDRTVALTYTSVEKIIKNTNINDVYLEDIGEGYAEFGCEGSNRCVMYYQTKQGVQDRRDIANEYGIAGVSYWRLGGELDILK